jgi:undecaprenyl-diphosphatase
MTSLAKLDLWLFHAIHDTAGKNVVLDAIGYAAAVYVIFGLLLGVFVVALSQVYGKRVLWRVTLASLVAFLYNAAIGAIVQQARPPLVTDAHPLIWPLLTDKSFPSDHAALSFAMAWIVYRCAPQPGKIFLVIAAVVALGRVYAGVHFPTDIIAGAIVGVTSAEFMHRFDLWLLSREHPSRKHS